MIYLQCNSSWTFMDGLSTTLWVLLMIAFVILAWEVGNVIAAFIKKQKEENEAKEVHN